MKRASIKAGLVSKRSLADYGSRIITARAVAAIPMMMPVRSSVIERLEPACRRPVSVWCISCRICFFASVETTRIRSKVTRISSDSLIKAYSASSAILEISCVPANAATGDIAITRLIKPKWGTPFQRSPPLN